MSGQSWTLPRAFQSPKGGAALRAAEPKKGHPFGCPFALEGTVKIDIWDVGYETDTREEVILPPFWPAAQAEFTSAEHLNDWRVKQARGPRNPKRRTWPVGHVLLFGASGVTRTPDLLITNHCYLIWRMDYHVNPLAPTVSEFQHSDFLIPDTLIRFLD